MIVRTALVAAAAAGAALLGAGITATLDISTPADVTTADVAPRLDVVASADAIGAAQFAFRALHPATPEPTAADMAAEPVPEPDIGDLFRADVTAVLVEKGRRVVVIVDPGAPKGRRTLRVGARYRDGWKVRAIDDSAIELRRAGETRRIDLFAPPPGGADGESGAPFALSGDVAPTRQMLSRDRALSTTQKE